ncbi:hypothetical protein BGZ65_005677 [Modicella reniformis]|uniref:Uncharacterized protein n=1 Tax=Modicella reniformis TaxID=1440133 RepID=A0A9P6IR80_9FUNG|nr:hypothetical protein BGZ65_005677 [Modicella reniformis]
MASGNNEDSVQSDDSASKTFNVWTPQEGRSWYRERLAQEKDIGMPEFCKEFGFTCEQDADSAFSELLSDSQLPLSSRITVDTAYERWKRNEGERFWARQATEYRVDILTTKTVEDLVLRSQFFASNCWLRTQDDSKVLKTNAKATTGSSTTATRRTGTSAASSSFVSASATGKTAPSTMVVSSTAASSAATPIEDTSLTAAPPAPTKKRRSSIVEPWGTLISWLLEKLNGKQGSLDPGNLLMPSNFSQQLYDYVRSRLLSKEPWDKITEKDVLYVGSLHFNIVCFVLSIVD